MYEGKQSQFRLAVSHLWLLGAGTPHDGPLLSSAPSYGICGHGTHDSLWSVIALWL
jgi:hypothetical protein